MTCQHAWTETTTGRGAKDLHCGPCSQPRSLGVEMGPSYPPFLHLELSKRPCTSFNVLELLIGFVSHDGCYFGIITGECVTCYEESYDRVVS